MTCTASLSAAVAARLQHIGLDELVYQRPDGDYVRNSRFHEKSGSRPGGELVAKELDRKP